MRFFTRKLVLPQHLNAGNTLFGGQCLAWIDEEAAIVAITQMGTPRIVTRKISEVNFLAPAYQGDIIEIGVAATKQGLTSATFSVIVRNKMTQRTIVEIAEIVFVALDEEGKPCTHLLSIQTKE